MKSSLHICNLANVAYSNCKILKEFGSDVRLVTHDIGHVMSQPEWQDLNLDPASFDDEWDFYGSWEKASVEADGYHRPDWYQDTCIHIGRAPYLESEGKKDNSLAKRIRSRIWNTTIRYGRAAARRMIQINHRMLGPIDCGFVKFKRFYGLISQGGMSLVHEQLGEEGGKRVQKLLEANKKYGPDWALTPLDVLAYAPQAFWLQCFDLEEEVVFAYVTSAIYSMLCADRPVVAVEIGTIRDIPFEGTTYGKVVAMMYRESDHVLITNPDNKIAAEKLGFESYSFCPHPVDEDIYKPLPDEELERDESAPVKIFAPARQNWKEKANDKMYRALAEVLKRGGNAELLIPEWGQDMKESRLITK